MTDKAESGRNQLSPWKIKDIRYVEQHYGRLPTEYIAIKLGRTVGAVKRIAQQSKVGKASPKPWTEDERGLVRQHYHKGLDYMLALLPGRTRKAISVQASHLEVRASNWSEQERQYLRDHHDSIPLSKIASVLGRSPGGVRRMAYEMHLGNKPRRPAKPWTEWEMAVLRKYSNQEAWIVRVQPLLPGRTRGAIGTQASKMGLTVEQAWTPEEIGILGRFYQEHCSKITDKLPGRTASAIKLQAARLGLRFRNRQPRQTPILPWSVEELSLLKKNQNASIGELLKLFPGRTKYAIERRRAGVKKRERK